MGLIERFLKKLEARSQFHRSISIGELMSSTKHRFDPLSTSSSDSVVVDVASLRRTLAGAMEVRGTIGYSNFLDEGPLHHLVTGGSARFYVTNRHRRRA